MVPDQYYELPVQSTKTHLRAGNTSQDRIRVSELCDETAYSHAFRLASRDPQNPVSNRVLKVRRCTYFAVSPTVIKVVSFADSALEDNN